MAALPEPINVCGLKFNGEVGIVFHLGGEVGIGGQVKSDPRTIAIVSPALTAQLNVGANLDGAICNATTNIAPKAALSGPIILDYAHNSPVYWDGLCLVLSGKADLAMTCCGIGLDKSVNLFDPIRAGNCPTGLRGPASAGADSMGFAPPRHASIAFSPEGFALAVWEGYTTVNGQIEGTAPVHSIFDG